MNPIFADLETTVFEVMSRPRARDRRGQSRPGLPGRSRPRGRAPEGGRGGASSGWNQYPPMMGLPELRQAVAAHYRHWQGLDLDPESRGHGHLRRHRGARRRAARADRARRRGGAVRADVRRLSAAGAAGRRRAALRDARSRRISRSTEEALAARLHAEDARSSLFNNPLNPTATIFSDADLALLADFCVAPRRRRALRRGLGARRLRRPPPHAADRASRACASAR